MTKARLIITAVVIEGRTQAEVADGYGVSRGWVSKLVARYRAEGRQRSCHGLGAPAEAQPRFPRPPCD